MAQFLAALAFILVAWLVVLARWRIRRAEGDATAFLMSASTFGPIGIYSLARQELNGVIVLVLLAAAATQFLFARYMLRVLPDDRPPSA